MDPTITEGWIHHEDSGEVKSFTESTPTIVTFIDHETTTYTIEENSTFETNPNEIKNVDEKNNETYDHFTSD